MDDSSNSTAARLDKVDRQILSELQRDGRLPVAELARRVHLSPTPCLERVKRLERDGFIRDYVARLDATRLGLPVLVFVEVALDRTSPEQFDRFRRLVQDIDEVLECHMIAGRFDYLLKVRTPSLSAFRRFLGEQLTSVPGLQHTHTYVALEEVKCGTRLPIRGTEHAKRLRPRRRSRTASHPT